MVSQDALEKCLVTEHLIALENKDVIKEFLDCMKRTQGSMTINNYNGQKSLKNGLHPESECLDLNSGCS